MVSIQVDRAHQNRKSFFGKRGFSQDRKCEETRETSNSDYGQLADEDNIDWQQENQVARRCRKDQDARWANYLQATFEEDEERDQDISLSIRSKKAQEEVTFIAAG